MNNSDFQRIIYALNLLLYALIGTLIAIVFIDYARADYYIKPTWIRAGNKPYVYVTEECLCGVHDFYLYHSNKKNLPRKADAYAYGFAACWYPLNPQYYWGKNRKSNGLKIRGCKRLFYSTFSGKTRVFVREY